MMEAFGKLPNITMGVGQVLFGQTVTLSDDVMAQHNRRIDTSPGKWVVWYSENEGSGGIVPYQYKQGSFLNALLVVVQRVSFLYR